jgi:hypothetical protein
MALWIAVLEDNEGMWNDEAIGDFTREAVEKLALEKWPKIDVSERRAIYLCSDEGEASKDGD